MECQNAEKLIVPYINGVLDVDRKEQFLNHIINCPKCYDEFEIYYIGLVVLRNFDDLEDSFDLKKIMEQKIQDELRIIAYSKVRKFIRDTLFVLAEMGLILVVIIQIVMWISR